MPVLQGWRYFFFTGGLIGFISATIYPTIIYPMMNPDYYRKFFILVFYASVVDS